MFFKRVKNDPLSTLNKHCVLTKKHKDCFKIMYYIHTKNIGLLMLEKYTAKEIIEAKYLISKYRLFYNTCKDIANDLKHLEGTCDRYEAIGNDIEFRKKGSYSSDKIKVKYDSTFMKFWTPYKIDDVHVSVNYMEIDKKEFLKDIIFFASYVVYMSVLRDEFKKNKKAFDDKYEMMRLMKTL